MNRNMYILVGFLILVIPIPIVNGQAYNMPTPARLLEECTTYNTALLKIVKTFGNCDNGTTIDHWLGLGYKISGVTVSKVYMTK